MSSKEATIRGSLPTAVPLDLLFGMSVCDGGATSASIPEEKVEICATPAFSGGSKIRIVARRSNSRTPAYQLREAIANKLHVGSDCVELIKGSTIVGDFDPEEIGPFQYILKDRDEEEEMETHPGVKGRTLDGSSALATQSQLRVSLLLNRPTQTKVTSGATNARQNVVRVKSSCVEHEAREGHG